MGKYFGVKFFLYSFFILLLYVDANSQVWTSLSEQTGDWDSNGTWDLGSVPDINVFVDTDVAVINGTVRRTGDLTFGNSDLLQVNAGDTLVITGNISFLSSAAEFINNGVTIVTGNFNALGLFTDVTNNGQFVVLGDYNGITFATVDEGPGAITYIEGNQTGNSPDQTVTEDELATNFPGLTDFVNTEAGTTLPVELVTFTAESFNLGIEVSWSTATEINNDYFSLQKSYDGVEFTEIGQVLGNGNSTDLNSYTFIDKEMREGLQYYQLIQYDYDGTAHHEGIISIKIQSGHSTADYSLYPNPATDIVFIKGLHNSINAIYAVYNTKGTQLVRETYEPNKGIDLLQFETGTYYILLQDGKSTKSLKLIKN